MPRFIYKTVTLRFAIGSSLAMHAATMSNDLTEDALENHLITVENLRLHYVESGKGPTVVLIHGNAGSAHDFELGTIQALSRVFHVIAVDRPRHGQGDGPE